MTLGLALHTAGATVGLAVGRIGEPYQEAQYDWGHDTSRQFHAQLAQTMRPYRWQDVAFLAVTRGPGSFTTLRLGLVTARILAQELNIPLFALSTLGVVSFSYSEPVAVSWPAGSDLVYGGIYERGNVRQPDQVFACPAWQNVITNWPEPLRVLDDIHTQAPAEPLLHWAEQLWIKGERPHWSDAQPFYGRSPVTVANP
ncbi:tRNA (adenosine(37)-N6)-threonylcarbamoyltransferase complex dimerization subunit type 1 TsaB [Gloeomargarita lithophora]|uniref:tRNA (adenosine(37)-N6)-threonylcarbamoyltransferase complex dimerization subunit type 1 TsaB n=1 Tax=Gloeomargarita lithophora TaxID=1188228 RepID=UPI0008F90856|nr:tRNA (adenosine(37)-N6)-threonylcarbamoyltransferase complex dimerization subunit type 1 TsaB [Gloeomargarita lithophora]